MDAAILFSICIIAIVRDSAENRRRDFSEQGFLESFQIESDALTDRISRMRLTSNGEDTAQNSEMNGVLLDLKALEEKLAAAAYFLPAYDSKARQHTLKEIKGSIDNLKSASRSSKKFSFRKRSSKANKENTAPEADCQQPPRAQVPEEAREKKGLELPGGEVFRRKCWLRNWQSFPFELSC